MDDSNFIATAPAFLTKRFNSINKYVWEMLFPLKVRDDLVKKKKTKAERLKELARLKAISNEASLIVFIFLINKFFSEGSEAAKEAVDTFKDLNVDGFFVGTTYFSERNENVIRGEKISQLLIASIPDETARSLILKSKYISEILDTYRRVI